MRCNDNDKLCLAALIVCAAKERAQHRYIANPGKLAVIVEEIVFDQARNGKAFAITQLNRCGGFAARESVDFKPIDRDPVCGVDIGNGGHHLKINSVTIDNARYEVQFDPEGFEFD